ncbi:MAG TPA: hypothetical protein DCY13_02380 [Verrucomicrobiales bacterium]|nr:hypothetical protein [Verrucomicrobiales bacterium]
MKSGAAGKRKRSTGKQARAAARPGRSLIHPVVIYPFKQPHDYRDLETLYELIARLDSEKNTYARPITVVDRKTHEASIRKNRFLEFRRKTVERHSDVIDAWCVDTCQMWYTGLGAASDRGGIGDIYWLIPGDFDYGSTVGQEVLGRLHDLPEICQELEQDLCIGEIATDHNNSKQLIDTYGTFALLYNWFPEAAVEIRGYTERPRSEFFAIRHSFLRDMLRRRWYAYEQTVILLLQAVFQHKHISRFFIGNISDLPEGRDTLASAWQQVERTERVLKSAWQERHQSYPDWVSRYRELEAQSEQVVRTSLNILQNLLK